MGFHLKAAFKEVRYRRAKSLFVIFSVGLLTCITYLAVIFTNTLLSEREKVLKPLKNLAVELSVMKKAMPESNFKKMAPEKVVAYGGLKAGDKFIQDQLEVALPLFDLNLANSLNRFVKRSTKTLIIRNMRLEGTVPDDITIPEYRVAPLSEAEREQLEAKLKNDKEYQDLSNKLAEIINKPKEQRSANEQQSLLQFEQRKRAIEEKYWPERFKKIPQREFEAKQVPVKAKVWYLASVSPKKDYGLVTAKDVVKGRFIASPAQEVVVASSFAQKENLTVGSSLTVKGKTYRVAGLVLPKLGRGGADIYFDINELKQLTGINGFNFWLLTAKSGDNADLLMQKLRYLDKSLVIKSNANIRRFIKGSLMVAAAITSKITLLLQLVIFLVATILLIGIGVITLTTRAVEIGVYKAIGWSNIRLLWQLFLENLILVTFGFLVSLMLIYGSKSVGPLMQVKLSANAPSLSSLYLAEKAPVKTVAVGFKVYFNWLLLRNIFAVAFVSITIASLTLGLRLGLIKPRVALSRLD